MKHALNHIVSIAKQKKLIIAGNTIKPLNSTGFMSKIFGAQTDRGQAIIHVVSKPLAEQEYQMVPEKIDFVAQLFKDIPQIPNVYLTGRLPGEGYFMVQEYKIGKPLGKRVYKEGKFLDEFLVANPGPYLAELQEIILNLHAFEVDGFGHLDFTRPVPRGEHDTWESFIIENFNRNLQTLQTSQEVNGIRYSDGMSFDEVRERMQSLLEINKEMFHVEKARFIHGDILNYSNVLVSDNGIEGIIDFEWALFGHPAWEFVFVQSPLLDVYISKAIEVGIIPVNFNLKRSIELHSLFWCVWGASVHAGNPEFGPALYSVFLDSLKHNL